MTRDPKCPAYRMNDQMICPHCVRQWDVDDPEPPTCQPPQCDHRITRPTIAGDKCLGCGVIVS